jgi:signal peptidase II
MNIRRVLRSVFFLLVIFANIGCDQITKNMVREYIGYQETIPLIGNHFVLTNVENSGAFLSLGSDFPFLLKTLFLSILPILFLIVGAYFLFTKKHINSYLALGISFTIGGGIGNIYDRLLYGSVTDFLNIDYHFIKTGIFNMADLSITIGIGLIFFSNYFYKENDQPLTPHSLP